MRNTAMRLPAAILAGFFSTLAIHAAAKEPAKIPAKTVAFDAREALAKLQAMDIFPEMEKEDSNFANAVSTEVECLECEKPSFFKSPAWPLRAARRVAAGLGVKPRPVAEIRRRLAETFELDDEAFQQIHGIQIVSARFSAGGEMADVTPQLAARVAPEGFAVDCDGALLTALAEESQFDRNTDEKDADYWKRQRALLAAVADARPGREALQITFEFQSETITAAVKSGEHLAISEEGKVSVAKIAPAARTVRATSPAISPRKSGGAQETVASAPEKSARPSAKAMSVRDIKR